MDTLPKDVVVEMALNLSPPDLINFCITEKRQNQIVCNSEIFWRRKLVKDYPGEYDEGIKNAKSIYIDRFTRISSAIEAFIPIFITKIFGETFNNFFTVEYKKELYKKIYTIYKRLYDIPDNEDNEELILYEIIDPSLEGYVPQYFVLHDTDYSSAGYRSVGLAATEVCQTVWILKLLLKISYIICLMKNKRN